MLIIRNLNLINVQSRTCLNKEGGGGGGRSLWPEGLGSRAEHTFLSLAAVAKYMSSPLHAHDQIILAC